MTIDTGIAQKYNISHIDISDGLSQNSIKDIHISDDGLLWIATEQMGVHYYDGSQLKHLKPGNELLSNFHTNLYVKNEKLYSKTPEGIAIYDGLQSMIAFQEEAPFKEYVLLDSTIIFIDAQGILKSSIKIYAKKGIAFGDSSRKHSSLYQDHNNHIWVSSKEGFISQITGVSLRNPIHLNPAPGFISSFTKTEDDQFYAIIGQEVYFLPHVQSEWKKLALPKEIVPTVLFVDSKDRLWIGSQDHGVFCFQKDFLLFHISQKNGLHPHITDIEEDLEKGIWFSTENGLFRLNNLLFSKHGKGNIQAVTLGLGNQIWSVNDTELSMLDEQIQFSTPLPPPLKGEQVHSMTYHDFQVLLCTQNALYQFNSINKQWSSNVRSFQEPISYMTKKVNGELLLGSGQTIYLLNQNQLSIFATLEKKNQASPFSFIQEDYEGNIWVGTQGDGLFFIDKMGKEIAQWNQENQKSSSNYFNDISFDRQHHVWVACLGSGLGKIYPSELTKPITTFEELSISSNNVQSARIDQEGSIWITTQKHVYKVTEIQNDYLKLTPFRKHYSKFETSEVSKSRTVITPNGTIWIPTNHGLLKILPDQEIQSEYAPKIWLEDIMLFSEQVNWNNYAEQLTKWTHIPKRLLLDNDENQISFHITGVSLDPTDQLSYQWKLIPEFTEWSVPQTSSTIHFSGLDPNIYALEVVAISERSGVQSTPITYTFQIKKPFFQRRGILFILFILLMGVIWWFFRKQMKSMSEAQEVLRQRVRRRTAELEMQKENLRAASEREKVKNDKLNQVLDDMSIQNVIIEEKNQELQKKSEALNLASQKVEESIEYAGSIQESVLSFKKKFHEVFHDSFVLINPKSKVRGDFYWVHESEEYIHLALIDCTNHGLSAAFLSIIGFIFLNQIVIKKPYLTPSEILHRLNHRVTETINSDQNSDINEGMDIAYCRFHKGDKKLLFAGARRPIAIVRNGEMIFVRGNFSSIGIVYNNIEDRFDDHEISIEKGDMIYLFSDGFVNQFNKEDKKYKKSNFKQLLLRVSNLPFEEQKEELQKEFEQWKDGVEQLDDMMIIGFQWHLS